MWKDVVERRQQGPPCRGVFPSAGIWLAHPQRLMNNRDMDNASTAPRKLVLLIGTVKGIFLYHSDETRTEWRLTGPHLGGWEVFSLCGDSRNGRILVGTDQFMVGPTIRTSRDFGA